MNLDLAAQLASQLFHEHKLANWSIVFDHARARCGSCDYTKQQITLSKHFVKLNQEDEVRNTLLHEIAHALVGPGHSHGPVWQREAVRIGAPVQATNTDAEMPQPKWVLVCADCKKIVARRHRRALKLANIRCGYCGPLKGQLAWQEARYTQQHAAEPARPN